MRGLFFLACIVMLTACSNDESGTDYVTVEPSEALNFSDILDIDFNNLLNYNNQYIPTYITKDNTPSGNPMTNEGATLGRILFYDVNLSTDNTISCASCHKQELAFGDNNGVSNGVDGTTGRHSMRLINSRFANETKFFWDERANSLEEQTTMPIQDHIEMGFSGENGDLSFTDLIAKLEASEYYPDLFSFAYGNSEISEEKIQDALSQFIRSIQSFDSKFDDGRVLANNDGEPFSNYTTEENLGKQLFLQAPIFDNQGSRINGGMGCAGCHQAPEFDIDPNSLNNGVVGTASGTGTDFTVTRTPSLRDVVKSNGGSNGQFMHIGISENLATVLTHYDNIIIAGNTNLDPRLRPNGNGQQLNMTQEEKTAVIAFIRTLAGANVYSDEKWSNPFIN